MAAQLTKKKTFLFVGEDDKIPENCQLLNLTLSCHRGVRVGGRLELVNKIDGDESKTHKTRDLSGSNRK